MFFLCPLSESFCYFTEAHHSVTFLVPISSYPNLSQRSVGAHHGAAKLHARSGGGRGRSDGDLARGKDCPRVSILRG